MQLSGISEANCKRPKIFGMKYYLFEVFSINSNKLSSRNLNFSLGSSVVNFSDFDKNKIFVHIWRRSAPERGISAGWNFFHLKYHSFKALSPIFRKFKWGTNFFYYCQLLPDFWPFFGKFFHSAGSKNDPNLTVLWHKMDLRMGEKIKKSLLKNSHFYGV